MSELEISFAQQMTIAAIQMLRNKIKYTLDRFVSISSGCYSLCVFVCRRVSSFSFNIIPQQTYSIHPNQAKHYVVCAEFFHKAFPKRFHSNLTGRSEWNGWFRKEWKSSEPHTNGIHIQVSIKKLYKHISRSRAHSLSPPPVSQSLRTIDGQQQRTTTTTTTANAIICVFVHPIRPLRP